MSLMDERQQSMSPWQQVGRGAIQAEQAGMLPSYGPVATEQMAFPDPSQVNSAAPLSPLPETWQSFAQGGTPAASTTRQLVDYTPVPLTTRQLADGGLEKPPVTDSLTDALAGTFAPVKTTTTLREPIIIHGSGKKRSGSIRPPKGRRLVLHITGTAVLLLIILGTLLAVVPTQTNGQASWDPFQGTINMIKGSADNPGLIVQQAATATAVTQDGYDPGTGTTYAGLPTPPPGSTSGGLNRFFYGQCTYWANMRYHELTGKWVPWLGNAWQWVAGAEEYGWIVSSTPHLHSIIVLQPGVQGAGWYGHVAIVEQINSDGSVLTSNWNWAGGWATLSYVTFYPGPGVSFVWAPGT
jgi:surface antigen